MSPGQPARAERDAEMTASPTRGGGEQPGPVRCLPQPCGPSGARAPLLCLPARRLSWSVPLPILNLSPSCLSPSSISPSSSTCLLGRDGDTPMWPLGKELAAPLSPSLSPPCPCVRLPRRPVSLPSASVSETRTCVPQAPPEHGQEVGPVRFWPRSHLLGGSWPAGGGWGAHASSSGLTRGLPPAAWLRRLQRREPVGLERVRPPLSSRARPFSVHSAAKRHFCCRVLKQPRMFVSRLCHLVLRISTCLRWAICSLMGPI